MVMLVPNSPKRQPKRRRTMRHAAVAVWFAIAVLRAKYMTDLTLAEMNTLRAMYFSNSPISSMSQLTPLLNALGVVCSVQDVSHLAAQHTTYKDGSVLQWRSLERIAMAAKHAQQALRGVDTDARSAFQAFDAENYGAIDPQEVASTLSMFALDPAVILSPNELSALNGSHRNDSYAANVSFAPSNSGPSMAFEEFERRLTTTGVSNQDADDAFDLRFASGARGAGRAGSYVRTSSPQQSGFLSNRGGASQQSGVFPQAGSSLSFRKSDSISVYDAPFPLATVLSVEGDMPPRSVGALPELSTRTAFDGARKWMSDAPQFLSPKHSNSHRKAHHSQFFSSHVSDTASESSRHLGSNTSGEFHKRDQQVASRGAPRQACPVPPLPPPSVVSPRHNPVGFHSSNPRFFPLQPLSKPAGVPNPAPLREHFRNKVSPRRDRELLMESMRHSRRWHTERLIAFNPTAYY